MKLIRWFIADRRCRQDSISKPNALLFFADDMGCGDFGLFNEGPARMPYVDVLANGFKEVE